MKRPAGRKAERARGEQAEAERAARVERWEWSEDIWDEVAFLQRWGGCAEIEVKARELADNLSWWLRDRIHASEEDLAAIAGLERARDRLKALLVTAEVVEAQLREHGWELHPNSRTLRRVTGRNPEGTGRRGRPEGLLQYAARTEFRRLIMEEGWPWSNSREAREEVRRRLADRFHPSLLGTGRSGAIHGALKNTPDPTP